MRLQRTWTGNIDEAATFFEEALPSDKNAELHIDLQGVTLINSIGIMRWMQWAKSLPADLQVFFARAPLQVVNQAALVDGFFPPNFKVESFQALYYCDPCSEEKAVLFENGRHYFYPAQTKGNEPEINMPLIHCPKCSKPMEPDFSGNRAFAFLRTKPGN